MLQHVKRKLRFWREYLQVGEYELSQLPKYVSSTRAAVDVGCNVGSYVYHLSRLASHVHAFDPNPHCIDLITDLRLGNVTTYQVGLSDHEGSAELRLPAAAYGGGDPALASLEVGVVTADQLGGLIPVSIKTLDSFALQNIGFLKIDVEGHEEAVLRGCRDTIMRERPTVLIEIEERHNPGGLARIDQLLQSWHYRGFFYLDGKLNELSSFRAVEHQIADERISGELSNRRKVRYINNFIFQPF